MLADENSPAFAAGGFAVAAAAARACSSGCPRRFAPASACPTTPSGPRAPTASSACWRPGFAPCSCRSRCRARRRRAPSSRRGAKVADVGCGAGVALIEMAKAFPRSEFHGYDISRHALDRARANAGAAGVDQRHVPRRQRRRPARRRPLRPRHHLRLHPRHDPPRPGDRGDPPRPQARRHLADRRHQRQPTFEENLDAQPDGGHDVRLLGDELHVVGAVGAGRPRARHARLQRAGGARMAAEAGFTRFQLHDFENPVNAYYEIRP